MAKPIKITPVLRGRDAMNFYSTLEQNKTKTVNKDFLASIKDAVDKFQANLKKNVNSATR